jgi:acid phosphatase type 7
VVVLNSMCEKVGGCASSSPMLTWLKNDLATNSSKKCTLAYFHHPLFSSGKHGNQTKMRPTWNALYAANADVVVGGHDHSYERFARQRPESTLDKERGIREFVVGTGGASHSLFGTIKANSQTRNASTYGVLKLTLNAESYSWRFVPVAGKTFTDSGTTTCH